MGPGTPGWASLGPANQMALQTVGNDHQHPWEHADGQTGPPPGQSDKPADRRYCDVASLHLAALESGGGGEEGRAGKVGPPGAGAPGSYMACPPASPGRGTCRVRTWAQWAGVCDRVGPRCGWTLSAPHLLPHLRSWEQGLVGVPSPGKGVVKPLHPGRTAGESGGREGGAGGEGGRDRWSRGFSKELRADGTLARAKACPLKMQQLRRGRSTAGKE